MTRDSQPTKITIVADNYAVPGHGLITEHGFSALVERGDLRLLFDTGQGKTIERNAHVLGIELSALSAVVLSHGHYDHTGGLLHVAAQCPGVRVIAHPAALASHMALGKGEIEPHEVGIPHGIETLTRAGIVFDLMSDFTEIFKGVFFTGYVPRRENSSSDSRLVKKDGESLERDPLEDDISLVIHTTSGPILLFGCAHAGVINVMEHVRAEIAIERFHAVIGGTHLGYCPPSATDNAIEAFERFGVDLVATSHCTGDTPNKVLKKHFNERFVQAKAGTVFEF
jgi:7,8-dihydropterin-6-yl-methyl-4-(beta-D-ribofuranosyl)aminobenzene 5'-phosphate synthase